MSDATLEIRERSYTRAEIRGIDVIADGDHYFGAETYATSGHMLTWWSTSLDAKSALESTDDAYSHQKKYNVGINGLTAGFILPEGIEGVMSALGKDGTANEYMTLIPLVEPFTNTHITWRRSDYPLHIQINTPSISAPTMHEISALQFDRMPETTERVMQLMHETVEPDMVVLYQGLADRAFAFLNL